MELSTILTAACLTVFASMFTGIGGLLSLFAKKDGGKFLSVSLGFSAGVMLYISFVEILKKAGLSLTLALGPKAGAWATAGGFFFGILVIALIDRLLPTDTRICQTPAIQGPELISCAPTTKLMRMGMFTALAIAIHNFPEGLATFTAALSDPKLGVPIATAIAIHNIPEGVSVAVPILYATQNRGKAFLISFLSGLTEPLGAFVGYLLLQRFFSPALFGIIFASTAGIMVYISLDELLPSAREYGSRYLAGYGMVAGMAVMAISLLLFL